MIIAGTTNAFFMVAPVTIPVTHCYELRVFSRSDNSGSSVRLEMHWLNAQGEELGRSTITSHTVATGQQWREAEGEFCAPAGSVATRVYAVAREGRVWLDDYSLRELAK